MEAFVNAFREAVLSFGNYLRATVMDRPDLQFKQKTVPLLRHCGKNTRTKLYTQICRSFLLLRK